MDDKKQAENNVPAVDTATPPEKDLISSEDVLAVISGDQVALVEQMERAKEDAWRYTAIMPVACIATGAFVVLFREYFVMAFTSGAEYSPAAITAAVGCLLVYGCEMPIRNIPYLMVVGIFRPGGNSKLAMICELCCLWFISIPLTAIFAFVFKLPFIYVFLFMFLLEDVPKTALCLYNFIPDKCINPVTEEGRIAFEKYKKK